METEIQPPRWPHHQWGWWDWRLGARAARYGENFPPLYHLLWKYCRQSAQTQIYHIWAQKFLEKKCSFQCWSPPPPGKVLVLEDPRWQFWSPWPWPWGLCPWLHHWQFSISLWSMGGASRVAGEGGQLPPVPYALPPGLPQSSWEKNYMCPLDPSRPLSQRKVYVKIHEMCKNTAQSMLNFVLFPVVNGQNTCC